MKSNAELYNDIMDKFNVTPNLNHRNITISVDNGLVTMAGVVKSFFEKQVAERSVKSVFGVKGIANDLEINLVETLRFSDADLAKAALEALHWDVEVPADKILVTVDNGRVKLTGEVEWWYQRRAAEKVVRRLKGVRSLTNEIIIKSRKVEKEIKKEILREFHRHAQIDAGNINVEANKNIVTLTGKVRTFDELKEAEYAAWSVPGVTQVNNQLSIC